MKNDVTESNAVEDHGQVDQFKTSIPDFHNQFVIYDSLKVSHRTYHLIVEQIPIDDEPPLFLYMRQTKFNTSDEGASFLRYFQRLEAYCNLPFAKSDITRLLRLVQYEDPISGKFEVLVFYELGEPDRIDIESALPEQIIHFLRNICILLQDLKSYNLYHHNLHPGCLVLVNQELKLSGFKPCDLENIDIHQSYKWRNTLCQQVGHFRTDVFLLGVLWIRFLKENIQQVVASHKDFDEVFKDLSVISKKYTNSYEELLQRIIDIYQYPDLTLEDIILAFDEINILNQINQETNKQTREDSVIDVLEEKESIKQAYNLPFGQSILVSHLESRKSLSLNPSLDPMSSTNVVSSIQPVFPLNENFSLGTNSKVDPSIRFSKVSFGESNRERDVGDNDSNSVTENPKRSISSKEENESRKLKESDKNTKTNSLSHFSFKSQKESFSKILTNHYFDVQSKHSASIKSEIEPKHADWSFSSSKKDDQGLRPQITFKDSNHKLSHFPLASNHVIDPLPASFSDSPSKLVDIKERTSNQEVETLLESNIDQTRNYSLSDPIDNKSSVTSEGRRRLTSSKKLNSIDELAENEKSDFSDLNFEHEIISNQNNSKFHEKVIEDDEGLILDQKQKHSVGIRSQESSPESAHNNALDLNISDHRSDSTKTVTLDQNLIPESLKLSVSSKHDVETRNELQDDLEFGFEEFAQNHQDSMKSLQLMNLIEDSEVELSSKNASTVKSSQVEVLQTNPQESSNSSEKFDKYRIEALEQKKEVPSKKSSMANQDSEESLVFENKYQSRMSSRSLERGESQKFKNENFQNKFKSELNTVSHFSVQQISDSDEILRNYSTLVTSEKTTYFSHLSLELRTYLFSKLPFDDRKFIFDKIDFHAQTELFSCSLDEIQLYFMDTLAPSEYFNLFCQLSQSQQHVIFPKLSDQLIDYIFTNSKFEQLMSFYKFLPLDRRPKAFSLLSEELKFMILENLGVDEQILLFTFENFEKDIALFKNLSTHSKTSIYIGLSTSLRQSVLSCLSESTVLILFAELLKMPEFRFSIQEFEIINSRIGTLISSSVRNSIFKTHNSKIQYFIWKNESFENKLLLWELLDPTEKSCLTPLMTSEEQSSLERHYISTKNLTSQHYNQQEGFKSEEKQQEDDNDGKEETAADEKKEVLIRSMSNDSILMIPSQRVVVEGQLPNQPHKSNSSFDQIQKTNLDTHNPKLQDNSNQYLLTIGYADSRKILSSNQSDLVQNSSRSKLNAEHEVGEVSGIDNFDASFLKQSNIRDYQLDLKDSTKHFEEDMKDGKIVASQNKSEKSLNHLNEEQLAESLGFDNLERSVVEGGEDLKKDEKSIDDRNALVSKTSGSIKAPSSLKSNQVPESLGFESGEVNQINSIKKFESLKIFQNSEKVIIPVSRLALDLSIGNGAEDALAENTEESVIKSDANYSTKISEPNLKAMYSSKKDNEVSSEVRNASRTPDLKSKKKNTTKKSSDVNVNNEVRGNFKKSPNIKKIEITSRQVPEPVMNIEMTKRTKESLDNNRRFTIITSEDFNNKSNRSGSSKDIILDSKVILNVKKQIEKCLLSTSDISVDAKEKIKQKVNEELQKQSTREREQYERKKMGAISRYNELRGNDKSLEQRLANMSREKVLKKKKELNEEHELKTRLDLLTISERRQKQRKIFEERERIRKNQKESLSYQPILNSIPIKRSRTPRKIDFNLSKTFQKNRFLEQNISSNTTILPCNLNTFDQSKDLISQIDILSHKSRNVTSNITSEQKHDKIKEDLSVNLILKTIQQMMSKGEMKEALQLLNQMTHVSDPRISLLKAEVLLRMEDHNSAKSTIITSLKLISENSSGEDNKSLIYKFLILLSNVLFAQGKHEEAYSVLESCDTDDKEMSERIDTQRIACLLKIGSFERVVDEYVKTDRVRELLDALTKELLKREFEKVQKWVSKLMTSNNQKSVLTWKVLCFLINIDSSINPISFKFKILIEACTKEVIFKESTPDQCSLTSMISLGIEACDVLKSTSMLGYFNSLLIHWIRLEILEEGTLYDLAILSLSVFNIDLSKVLIETWHKTRGERLPDFGSKTDDLLILLVIAWLTSGDRRSARRLLCRLIDQCISKMSMPCLSILGKAAILLNSIDKECLLPRLSLISNNLNKYSEESRANISILVSIVSNPFLNLTEGIRSKPFVKDLLFVESIIDSLNSDAKDGKCIAWKLFTENYFCKQISTSVEDTRVAHSQPVAPSSKKQCCDSKTVEFYSLITRFLEKTVIGQGADSSSRAGYLLEIKEIFEKKQSLFEKYSLIENLVICGLDYKNTNKEALLVKLNELVKRLLEKDICVHEIRLLFELFDFLKVPTCSETILLASKELNKVLFDQIVQKVIMENLNSATVSLISNLKSNVVNRPCWMLIDHPMTSILKLKKISKMGTFHWSYSHFFGLLQLPYISKYIKTELGETIWFSVQVNFAILESMELNSKADENRLSGKLLSSLALIPKLVLNESNLKKLLIVFLFTENEHVSDRISLLEYLLDHSAFDSGAKYLGSCLALAGIKILLNSFRIDDTLRLIIRALDLVSDKNIKLISIAEGNDYIPSYETLIVDLKIVSIVSGVFKKQPYSQLKQSLYSLKESLLFIADNVLSVRLTKALLEAYSGNIEEGNEFEFQRVLRLFQRLEFSPEQKYLYQAFINRTRELRNVFDLNSEINQDTEALIFKILK